MSTDVLCQLMKLKSGCSVSARRKSNCVKEVEKIKQRRDERRAHQMVIKEQYDQEYDMNDPNWEFIKMIM